MARDGLDVLHTEPDEPEAAALIAGLLADLTARIGADAVADFDEAHRAEFAPWLGGDLLVLRENDETVAGGAFRRYDSNTVQLDWLWTRPDRRRAGLGRRVVAELEYTAAWRGYQRSYAVAGPGRPEVRRLFAARGYTPLGSATGSPLDYLGFVKTLTQLG
jgi:polar amino acid transport system permease protein